MFSYCMVSVTAFKGSVSRFRFRVSNLPRVQGYKVHRWHDTRYDTNRINDNFSAYFFFFPRQAKHRFPGLPECVWRGGMGAASVADVHMACSTSHPPAGVLPASRPYRFLGFGK